MGLRLWVWVGTTSHNKTEWNKAELQTGCKAQNLGLGACHELTAYQPEPTLILSLTLSLQFRYVPFCSMK